MRRAGLYAMALAALPRHGADLFSAKRPPISRLGLDRRLSLIPLPDQAEIAAIEGVLSWDRAQRFSDDQALLAHADAVLADIRSWAVRRLVEERFAVRSIVAALRARHAGEAAPMHRSGWGRAGRLGFRIERNWAMPGFGLSADHAWVGAVDRAIGSGDPLGAERIILAEIWKRLGRADLIGAQGYLALVIYVLRWNIIARWTQYNSEAARSRFSAWTAALARGAA